MTGERHVLFVCSKNQWRSPTAEAIYRRHPGLTVRSAGTARSARRQVSEADLHWADVVIVMEDKHQQRLRAMFPGVLAHTPMHVLDIPDDYRFMDPALIAELRDAIDPLLG